MLERVDLLDPPVVRGSEVVGRPPAPGERRHLDVPDAGQDSRHPRIRRGGPGILGARRLRGLRCRQGRGGRYWTALGKEAVVVADSLERGNDGRIRAGRVSRPDSVRVRVFTEGDPIDLVPLDRVALHDVHGLAEVELREGREASIRFGGAGIGAGHGHENRGCPHEVSSPHHSSVSESSPGHRRVSRSVGSSGRARSPEAAPRPGGVARSSPSAFSSCTARSRIHVRDSAS